MADDQHEEQITDLSRGRTRKGRADRADFLEGERTGRADFLEEERVRRAADLAYADGKRRAEVDSRLASHEIRLAAINGSIERHAKALEGMRDEFASRNAVEADRVRQLKTANENSLSSRMFISGVVAIVVTLLGVILSLLIAVHVI